MDDNKSYNGWVNVNLKLYFEYINDILNIFLAEWEQLKSYFEYILRLHLKSLNYSLNIFSVNLKLYR